MKTLKIQEFIQGRDVKYSTVFQYIKRNPEKFEGHIGRANNIVLDTVAVQLLDEKYPIPEPVQVIQDTSARDDLLELHKKYAVALEKIEALTEQNAKLLVIQSKQRFLEEENISLADELDERDQKLNKLLEEKAYWERQWKSQEKEISQLEEIVKRERVTTEYQIDELKKKLNEEKAKSWWDKLRKR